MASERNKTAVSKVAPKVVAFSFSLMPLDHPTPFIQRPGRNVLEGKCCGLRHNGVLRSSDCGAIRQLYPLLRRGRRVLRRVFGADSSGGCYKHLVHAPPVHIQDLEGVALPIEAVASCRNAPQVVHHHAAHRVVVCLLLARQHAEPQVLPKLVSPSRPSTIREPSARRTMGASAGSSSSGTSPISASSTSVRVTRPSICPRSSITRDTGRPDLLNASKALVAGAPSGTRGERCREPNRSAFLPEACRAQVSLTEVIPSRSSRSLRATGKNEWPASRARRRISSGWSSASSHTTLGRGVISSLTGRSSSLRARRTRSLSSSSKTPAWAPSSMRISTSCSLTGGAPVRCAPSNLRTPSVETLKNQTAGAVIADSRRIGPATREATASAPLRARRLGTNSPMISDR